MAGRKQHFIPRHFLKEFVIQDGSDKLWMHRRGLPNPVPVSRDDAAATRDFYSKPAMTDAPTLDDLITEYENELKFGVEEARAVAAGDTLPSHLISEIVAHLTIRAAYLRELIDVGASELVSSIDTLIHRPSELFDGIELPKHRVPSKFEKMAIEQFEQHPINMLTNLTPKAVVRLLYQAIREDFDALQNAASNEFDAFLERFQGEFQAMPRKVHTQVLKKELVPGPRKAKLEEFRWRIVDFPTGDAVLPDCVAVAEDANGWGPYIMADHKSMTRVVVPLSSSKLAVGSVADDWGKVVEIYSRASRESCFTFYLANRRDEVSQTDLAELGGPARAKIANKTSSAFRETVEEFLGDNASVFQEDSEPVTWTDLPTDEGFSYSVSFKDFGDEAYVQRVAESLNEVVTAFGGYLPIQRLDGITFAVDYAGALQGLDRGLGVDRSIDPSAGANPNGVAMPLAVRRDDGIKTHIVLRGYLAEQLISEDETLREEAISVISYCLGTAAFNSLLERKFPGTLLSPYTDPYEGWLFQYNESLLATYFSTRLLAPNTETLEFYSEQARLQIGQMISATTDAHTQYQTDGDHKRFFEVCASQASGLMTAIARYLAARASVIGPRRPGEPLDQKLAQLELMKWSKLFEEDLAAFNRRLGDWANLEEMHFLNRHFERLLFAVGVLPDQLNDGSLYIHTSGEHRLASLTLS
ncbi:hypothetical protein [Phaeobacter sp. C3_T13_0]|uniref:hypothetical protein n=1 Tax=Phaeobacter cretensis TaxID=3342641 RepID=UPI0039BD9037